MDLREMIHDSMASYSQKELPLVIEARDGASPAELAALVHLEQARLRAQLLENGALLFRGFDVTRPDELSRIIAAAGDTAVRYVAGISPRRQLGEEVYTSTELPPPLPVPLHGELCYLETPPRRLWFASAIVAQAGGETRLADARAVYRSMAPDLRQRFVERGLR
jgi:alpha-ketoglutarate-dependent taurine dioxygenase